jgi:hypothetical protein
MVAGVKRAGLERAGWGGRGPVTGLGGGGQAGTGSWGGVGMIRSAAEQVVADPSKL